MESFYLIKYFVIVMTLCVGATVTIVDRMRRRTLVHKQFRHIDVHAEEATHSVRGWNCGVVRAKAKFTQRVRWRIRRQKKKRRDEKSLLVHCVSEAINRPDWRVKEWCRVHGCEAVGQMRLTRGWGAPALAHCTTKCIDAACTSSTDTSTSRDTMPDSQWTFSIAFLRTCWPHRRTWQQKQKRKKQKDELPFIRSPSQRFIFFVFHFVLTLKLMRSFQRVVRAIHPYVGIECSNESEHIIQKETVKNVFFFFFCTLFGQRFYYSFGYENMSLTR